VGNSNMTAIYSNGSNRWNILGFNFTKRDALSSVYKISMISRRIFVKEVIKRIKYIICIANSNRSSRYYYWLSIGKVFNLLSRQAEALPHLVILTCFVIVYTSMAKARWNDLVTRKYHARTRWWDVREP
jgi:hypothetical protein